MKRPDAESFLIQANRSVRDAMRQLSDLGEKELFVIDDKKNLLGALSDGDIRKWLLKNNGFDAPVSQVCNRTPKKVIEEYSLDFVRDLMLSLKIECVPVVDRGGRIQEILRWDEVFSGKVERHQPQLNVPVVIMAGGHGKRLDPFTRILPKPLIPIGDRPIIELIMEKFAVYGVKNFYVSVFHKARMIKSYFEDTDGKYDITYVEEKEPLGTIGGIRFLKDQLKGPFFVTNCDVIINSDYSELLRFHQEHGFMLTLVVSHRHYQIPYGVCELEGGTLKSIQEKPRQDLLINTGMYVMDERVFPLIPPGQPFSPIDLIAVLKQKQMKVGAFPVSEQSWVDVGQWEEYQKVVHDMQERLGAS